MNLRQLKLEDAPLMLEWMHDSSVVEHLKGNFIEKTLEDCELFIKDAQDSSRNQHYAIVDESDNYLGTISLKNIHNDSAEFGIAIRKVAMGQGIASKAMKEIVQYGFERLKLKEIFWCVDPSNERALRFYDRNGYQRTNPDLLLTKGYSPEEICRYIWYKVVW